MAARDTGTPRRGRPPKAAKDAAGNSTSSSDAVVGFEEKLWQMADKLRDSMDAAEYKHVVLGLIFLKYISDAFEEKHAALTAGTGSGADPEDPGEYRAENIFWVPREARWSHLQGSAKQATIGKLVDDAMVAIEAQNPTLKGVLPKDYGRPVDRFEMIVESWGRATGACDRESAALPVIRDALLPRLLAGEVQVAPVAPLAGVFA